MSIKSKSTISHLCPEGVDPQAFITAVTAGVTAALASMSGQQPVAAKQPKKIRKQYAPPTPEKIASKALYLDTRARIVMGMRKALSGMSSGDKMPLHTKPGTDEASVRSLVRRELGYDAANVNMVMAEGGAIKQLVADGLFDIVALPPYGKKYLVAR